MSAPIIWNGNYAKLLKDQLKLGDTASVLTGTDDPSLVAKDAPKGSVYLNVSNGKLYVKQDAGSSTNWTYLISSSEKASSNGVATLDGSGKVPLSQLNLNAVQYRGLWDASVVPHGSPALVDGVGTAGDEYQVSVAGTRNLGSGNIVFAVGDRVVYNGTIWQNAGASAGVSSFNGRVGAVTPASNDYTWAQVDKTTSNITGITNRSHSDLQNLSSDDHTQYVLATGTRAFTGVVGGIDPTSSTHLSTRNYVDNGLSGKQNTLTPGSISESTSSILTITNGSSSTIGPNVTVQVKQASASQSGYLSSTDWSTFNGKQNTLSLGNLTSSTPIASTDGTGAVIGSGVAFSWNPTADVTFNSHKLTNVTEVDAPASTSLVLKPQDTYYSTFFQMGTTRQFQLSNRTDWSAGAENTVSFYKTGTAGAGSSTEYNFYGDGTGTAVGGTVRIRILNTSSTPGSSSNAISIDNNYGGNTGQPQIQWSTINYLNMNGQYLRFVSGSGSIHCVTDGALSVGDLQGAGQRWSTAYLKTSVEIATKLSTNETGTLKIGSNTSSQNNTITGDYTNGLTLAPMDSLSVWISGATPTLKFTDSTNTTSVSMSTKYRMDFQGANFTDGTSDNAWRFRAGTGSSNLSSSLYVTSPNATYGVCIRGSGGADFTGAVRGNGKLVLGSAADYSSDWDQLVLTNSASVPKTWFTTGTGSSAQILFSNGGMNAESAVHVGSDGVQTSAGSFYRPRSMSIGTAGSGIYGLYIGTKYGSSETGRISLGTDGSQNYNTITGDSTNGITLTPIDSKSVIISGSISFKRKGLVAGDFPYTALGSDCILGVTDTAAPRTITLPTSTGIAPGFILQIKDESGAAETNNITVQRNGSDTIDGTTSIPISVNYGALKLYTDGAGHWFSL